jgi:hypothetical protein
VIFYLAKGITVKKGEHVDAMIERKGMDEVVPNIVKETYRPDNRYWYNGAAMSVSDIGCMFKLIVRAPCHPYFVLKTWMNVVHYSDMIRRHLPKVMIQFGEFSYSSSILTAYCNRNDVKHINIMHGEKLFFIRDSFFHYNECYVWDEYYAELFRSLRAEPNQFIVALPESMHINISQHINDSVYADYKYYLAVITEDEMEGIVDSLSFAIRKGKTVKYRPHPRYTDFTLLRKYVKEEEIELPSEVGILESISNLDYAVGSFSTVLSQAYFSGEKVILDDMSFEQEYNKLKELQYILSSKDIIRLSQLQS